MDIKQNSVLKFFYEICQVPRESGNEKGIQNYLINFAKVRQLDYYADEFNNVIIYKNTSKKEPIILQAHTDMVCVKSPNFNFDFTKDAIVPQVKGKYLTAKNTSLGADNGIGLSMILSLLDSDEPLNIEAVFTSTEETTMQGAYNLNTSKLKSKKMICLDGFCENQIITATAGFADFLVTMNRDKKPLSQLSNIYQIEISGLQGGHSGYDINKNRGSSHKLMAEFLLSLPQLNLIDFEGGKNFNVIPSKTTSFISTSLSFKQLKSKLNKFFKFYKKQYKGLKVDCQQKIFDSKPLVLKNGINFLNFILNFNQGVLLEDANKNVLASQNISEVSAQKGYLNIGLRTPNNDKQKFYTNHLVKLCQRYKLNGKVIDSQPAFNALAKSSIVKCLKQLNKNAFEEKMHIAVELGIMQNKIKGLDAVIISPTILDAHSVKERVKLSSITFTYDWLKKFLQTY